MKSYKFDLLICVWMNFPPILFELFYNYYVNLKNENIKQKQKQQNKPIRYIFM